MTKQIVNTPYIGQLLEARDLLEQLPEEGLCNECWQRLWPIISKAQQILSKSVNEHEAKNNQHEEL